MTDLAYRGQAGWRDMSEYVVHFTKQVGPTSPYRAMMFILSGCEVRAGGPWGCARNLDDQLGGSQRAACFSEVPLDLLGRLVGRRSSFGIGFHQEVLLRSGGMRVWYLDLDTPAALAFNELKRQAMLGGINPTDRIWQLTPLVDNPGEWASGSYRFEWEREWRVPGGLRFQPSDVAFLFIDESLHSNARAFFADVEADNSGPVFHCPFIDPTWDMQRIQQEVATLQTYVPPTPVASCWACGSATDSFQCPACGEMQF